MNKEDFQNTLDDFSKQSFELGARSFASYLLRMRMAMHERRLDQVQGQGPALVNNRRIHAGHDLEKYKNKLKVALEALLDDADDWESIVEIDEEIRNSRDVFEGRLGA